jgi:hypothetical protein
MAKISTPRDQPVKNSFSLIKFDNFINTRNFNFLKEIFNEWRHQVLGVKKQKLKTALDRKNRETRRKIFNAIVRNMYIRKNKKMKQLLEAARLETTHLKTKLQKVEIEHSGDKKDKKKGNGKQKDDKNVILTLESFIDCWCEE